jgi:hypothetical protein
MAGIQRLDFTLYGKDRVMLHRKSRSAILIQVVHPLESWLILVVEADGDATTAKAHHHLNCAAWLDVFALGIWIF